MMTIVKCKEDTAALMAGEPYQVLDERSWGYRLLVGKVTAWFRKDLFFKPVMVPSDG